MAEEHWRRWLPRAYAEITNREDFFRRLEDEAQSQLEDLEDSLCGPDRDDESFSERLARFTWARRSAEEIVLHEVLLTKPEETSAEQEHQWQEAETERELTLSAEAFWRLDGQLRDDRVARGDQT